MNSKRLDKSYQDLLYLIRCYLRNEGLSTEWEITTPLSSLLILAKFHSIEVMLYELVKQHFTTEQDSTVVKNWQIEHDKAFRRHLLFETERAAILGEMEKQGIWHMVLKGVVLQDYYPKPYYRQMSDNDILFDGTKNHAVKKIMVDRGYRVGHFEGEHDDVYYKDPIYNFEMHFKLSVESDFESYFDNLDDRLISSSQHQKMMSELDFYVYLLAHELKHYKNSGTGLRGLIDLFYYWPNRSKDIELTELSELLTELEVLAFDKQRHELVEALFMGSITEFQSTFDSSMLNRYCSSGTYGTLEQSIETKLSKNSTGNWPFIQYYFRKAFMTEDVIKHYPFFNKYKILYPVFIGYRLSRGLLNKRNWKELKMVVEKTILKSK